MYDQKPPVKPPSSWRTGERGRQLEQKAKPRAVSLNPLIYPSWWGEDSGFEKVRDKSEGAPARTVKDSLEKRLQQAKI